MLKNEFIKLAIDCNALQFGTFTLKSGRNSPYFFNTGLFYTGHALQQLGKFYASTLIESGIKFDNLFGPAYKGLPLATTTAVNLAENGVSSTVTFNRKEEKDHGEGGQLIGSPLIGRTVIIDDVITAGTAFRESKKLIDEHGGNVVAVIIALDRCEVGSRATSTISEIKSLDIEVLSIINIFDIINYLNKIGKFKAADTITSYCDANCVVEN
jgi:orotate phosphoribosyltransferase